jgi:hypothetical protein
MTYLFVTEELLRLLATGRFAHPTWILRSIPLFYRYYARSADGHDLESHWQTSFARMDSAFKVRRPLVAVGRCIVQGMRAHIDEDLPRALALLYRERYVELCDYVRLRADFYCLAPAFDIAARRVAEAVPPHHYELGDRVRMALPSEVVAMRRPRGYDLRRARWNAFERGHRLAGLIGGDVPAAER